MSEIVAPTLTHDQLQVIEEWTAVIAGCKPQHHMWLWRTLRSIPAPAEMCHGRSYVVVSQRKRDAVHILG